MARIYINTARSGRACGSGLWKCRNAGRKMHFPGHTARRAGAGRTVFTFPEKMGVGGMKQGEKGVSFQKFAKHLLLVFSLEGVDDFQRLDHTEARV